MTDGPVSNEMDSLRRVHKEEQLSVQELQSVISSDKFRKVSNAYRILDMAGKHSINLFGYFPDSRERITGRVEKGVALQGETLRDLQDQFN